jgi:hypothetical protein
MAIMKCLAYRDQTVSVNVDKFFCGHCQIHVWQEFVDRTAIIASIVWKPNSYSM